MFEVMKTINPPEFQVKVYVKNDIFVEASTRIENGKADPLKVRIMGPHLCAGGLFLNSNEADDVAAAIPQAIRIIVEEVRQYGIKELQNAGVI
jgi:methionine synthase II (cobalamin-independent)